MTILGTVTDVAGEVVEVGQGVQKFKPGDKVVAFLTHTVSVHFIPLVKLSISRGSFTYKFHLFVRMEVDWLNLLQLVRA